MFVIKCRKKYVKFRSYSSIVLVDRPEMATLYTRIEDARRREKDPKGYYWLDREKVSINEFSIWGIEFNYNESRLTEGKD